MSALDYSIVYPSTTPPDIRYFDAPPVKFPNPNTCGGCPSGLVEVHSQALDGYQERGRVRWPRKLEFKRNFSRYEPIYVD